MSKKKTKADKPKNMECFLGEEKTEEKLLEELGNLTSNNKGTQPAHSKKKRKHVKQRHEIRLVPNLSEKLKFYCLENKMTKSAVVEQALEQFLGNTEHV